MNRPAGGVQPSVRPVPEARDDDPGSADPDDTGVPHEPPVVPRPNGHRRPGGEGPGPAVNGDTGNGRAPGPPAAGHPANGNGSPAAVPPRPRSPSPGRRARRDAGTGAGSSWLQDEIRRRVADGAGGTGRHARVEPAAGGPAAPDAPPDDAAGTAPAAPAGPTPDDAAPAAGARLRPGPRPRSDLEPDPYAPGGMRPGGSGGWPDGSSDGGKQWPPVAGPSAELPRRTPGATSWPPASSSWAVNRDALIGGPDAVTTAAPEAPGAAEADAPPETRPVPTRWTATGRRATAVPDAAPPAPAAHAPGRTAPADPADPGRLDASAALRDGDDLDEDDLDEDDLDEDDLGEDDLDDLDPHAGLRGPAAERTEVIWRAPHLDDSPVVAAPAPATEPGVPGPAPYTGARPRRFAAAPTDAPATDADEPEAGGDPSGGRVRIVLSERRSTAHSSRGLSDVQDPGPVGTLLRNTLVRNQFALAMRVCVVALAGLGLTPALFVAFPVLGEVSVLGIRLPWLLLGGLAYPFLLGLGWWYVASAEAVEQEFAEDVTDR